MFVATKSIALATTITGSLPRPQWFTQNLEGRPFLTAFNGDAVYREQYSDAVAALISDQTRAGLDVVSDGEMRFDLDVGGRSWFGYAFDRMDGLAPGDPGATRPVGSLRRGFAQRAGTAGDIMSEFIDTLRPPRVIGPVGPGSLQYDAIWKVAQRLTARPVKMGSCCAQMLDRQVAVGFYKDRRDQLFSFSRALNQEYQRLVDAGCAVIQIEEPCLHGSDGVEGEISFKDYVTAFNVEVAGLRQKTEIWCHTCWGNPFAQRLAQEPSYKPALPYLDQLDVDVVTIEAAENGGAEIAEVAAALSADKKLCIGVVSHRSLQVELAENIATLIRKALQSVPPERLVLSSDCGFGRQGMSRTHALYKMIAMVRGANIVRRELGLPESEIAAADPRFRVQQKA
jgi:5-methyltetrahydropteroyltriglutamate--homocysteine methyltransferase